MNIIGIDSILGIIEMRESKVFGPLFKACSWYIANDCFNLANHFLGDVVPNTIQCRGRVALYRLHQFESLLLSVPNECFNELIRLGQFPEDNQSFE